MSYNTQEVQDTKIIKFITEDRYHALRHVILLLGTLTILCFSKDATEFNGSFRFLKVLCIYIPLVSMYYVNINILVPRLFFKGSYILYSVLLILIVIISLTGIYKTMDFIFLGERVLEERDNYAVRGFYESTIILITIILVTTMIKLFQRWMRDNEKINDLRNIALTMELNELRNQINPHFLFNMLNGIKSLIRTDVDKATTVIMKLSHFLRYQLYEDSEQKALLKSELDFISNFLELEKIRRDNFSVKIVNKSDIQILNSILLPPNLFTIFIENAVKHSVNINGDASYVSIIIEIKANNLYFYCINSKDPDYLTSLPDKKSAGLGLANIKRRLELLYGINHVLDIKSSKTEFNVKLTIPL